MEGYALDLWAVTGKSSVDSDSIDTWFFGLELQTPKGNGVNSPDADDDELNTTAGFTYVGHQGEVYFTYVQFDNPSASSGDNYESFSCSKVIDLVREEKKYTITDRYGQSQDRYTSVVNENLGDAIVMNYQGNRDLSDNSSANTYTE
eukprot:CAMPEP_0116877700 /NCGR_PEP_ID=MMETSP0463-20121206/9446_1 /TAXON_ID=181622 /ORGANISM="Strombidinopsis sp, Strain SopsisLIS2011" /LENGTH=146 /DNA_ID=CAMNT_0004525175 /DNA_START=108 /DNA_END=548 /DNA_ORIENTATION=-